MKEGYFLNPKIGACLWEEEGLLGKDLLTIEVRARKIKIGKKKIIGSKNAELFRFFKWLAQSF